MSTIYRGFDIIRDSAAWWGIFQGDARFCETQFPTEEAAMNWIDKHKREAAQAKAKT